MSKRFSSTSLSRSKGLANCLIAIETANRMRISPLMVMQNTNIIQGKPSWSAQFIIATITGCGRYENFDYEMVGEKEDLKIRCTATRIKDGKEINGSWVSIAMARSENWIKNPKWKSMPEHMLKWRAATFFGRQHVADLLLGIQTEDEIVDISPVNVTVPNTPHEAAIAQPKKEEPVDDFPPVKVVPKVEVDDGFAGF